MNNWWMVKMLINNTQKSFTISYHDKIFTAIQIAGNVNILFTLPKLLNKLTKKLRAVLSPKVIPRNPISWDIKFHWGLRTIRDNVFHILQLRRFLCILKIILYIQSVPRFILWKLTHVISQVFFTEKWINNCSCWTFCLCFHHPLAPCQNYETWASVVKMKGNLLGGFSD